MLGMTTALRCGARWRRKECEVTMPKAKSGDSRRVAVRDIFVMTLDRAGNYHLVEKEGAV